ncbi:PepSY domain-containing protein [Chitinophaga agrisoli]|uniref:PepSY domain-containing protein n=1 Tax=Chitinophaga agrisoli TaxID=2607653 RepID=A0A5B2W3P4_9BACT|nr:PepSY-associated TM helix domain-containing protein [Chitinophaga agrisoli]KAA2245754.1 PepSY domain-containing protein [Chitinophaga agrisoli]
MTLKKIISTLHLWLGLASGLVIVVMALTGAIYAFQPELSKATQPYLTVKAENKPFLPLSVIKDIAVQQLPGIPPTRILFKGKDASVMVQFFAKKPSPYYYAVYLNPYSGEVLKVKDVNKDFFRFMLNGHMYLWLPQEIGRCVTSGGCLIFFIMIVSGIVMWWPTNKARRKTSFKVKWGASPKRLNYDLHNVLGFYISWGIIFTVFTGMVWAFEWAGNAEFALLGGKAGQRKPPVPVCAKVPATGDMQPLDKIYQTILTTRAEAKGYQFNLPANDSAAIIVRVYPDKGTYYRTDHLYFDQYTAEAIPLAYWSRYADAGAAEKAIRMNYDIHTGGIAGLPGRIIIFLAALMAASLPITGFYIWWGKRKKTAKKLPYQRVVGSKVAMQLQ